MDSPDGGDDIIEAGETLVDRRGERTPTFRGGVGGLIKTTFKWVKWPLPLAVKLFIKTLVFQIH